MDTSRRHFLKSSGALFVGAGFSSLTPLQAFACAVEEKWNPIRGRTDYVREVGAKMPIIDNNGSLPIVPASMTKIDTLAIAIRQIKAGNLDPNKKMFLSRNARRQPPFKSGLSWVRIEEAMNLCAVRSYNDLAVAIAEEIAGTEWDFHRKYMMPLAEELDMKNSKFWNVSGLPKPGIGENITTAEDLTKLVEDILTEHSDYSGLFGQSTYRSTRMKRSLVNTNGLLQNSVNKYAVPTEGVDWGKTGFINKAGFQIALSCEREGRRLIVVSTGHKSAMARNKHVSQMIDDAFDQLAPKPKKHEPEIIDSCPDANPYRCIV